MKEYDVILLGAGLGSLLCGAILAKEGLKVLLLEQNKQIGGCLQTFSFDKKVFDSCVHYIGAMDEGQTQHKIFEYLGIAENLKLQRLDIDGFDRILFGSEAQQFPQAQGSKTFVEQLLPFFPREKDTLTTYIKVMEDVANHFPLYQLKNGDASLKNKVRQWSLNQVLDDITPNHLLKQIWMGNNLLYAPKPDSTPFYVHALVVKSYIDSAYKCKGGSSQISKLLWKCIQEHGGEILRNEKVIKIMESGGRVQYVESELGNRYYGKQFISNIHPAQTLSMLESSLIKPVFKNRITQAENSISAMMLNIVLKPKKVCYRNHNIYWHREQDTLKVATTGNRSTIDSYALYYTEDEQNPGYADTVAVLLYAQFDEVKSWQHTHNRSAAPALRDDEYEVFKQKKSEQILKAVSERFPDIVQHIASLKMATPLTFRDYMGTRDGSIYGMQTNTHFPEASSLNVKTRIPNLYFTGQNVNLHGVLGVSMTAILTCAEFLGLDYILEKINQNRS